MDYNYVIDYLTNIISYDGTVLSSEGYNPSYNIALMVSDITKLICKLKDEANQEQKGK